jgi:hypothetical protein
MEVLEKLQAVHETMGLLQSHSLVSPHSSSNNNRFLADFVIFLEGVCKESEEMVTRCEILMDVIPKVCPYLPPSSVLDRALNLEQWLPATGT